MARNFTGTASTTAAELTITGSLTRSIVFTNTGDTNNLLVNIPAIHGDSDSFIILPGGSQQFTCDTHFTNAFVESSASTTGYNAGVVEGNA